MESEIKYEDANGNKGIWTKDDKFSGNEVVFNWDENGKPCEVATTMEFNLKSGTKVPVVELKAVNIPFILLTLLKTINFYNDRFDCVHNKLVEALKRNEELEATAKSYENASKHIVKLSKEIRTLKKNK